MSIFCHYVYLIVCSVFPPRRRRRQLKRNVLSVDFHISKYAKICDELRAEVSELKVKLASYESATLPLPTGGTSLPTPRGSFALQLETEK